MSDLGWNLKCLLCGRQDIDGLVRMQEHAMRFHGYTQDDHRRVTKRPLRDGAGYIWTFPDGRDWLEAKRRRPN